MEKVKMGVIGVGTFGEHHARIHAEGEETILVGVADLNRQRAEGVAQKYGARCWFTDYRDLLEEDLDAVSIVVPDHVHLEPCLAAAASGLHILVEKPLATDSREAERIVRAAEEAGVMLMVDFANRWNPPFVQARERIRAGGIGDVQYIKIRLNDTIWVPTEMLSWADRSSVLWFLGSHTFDLCRWLLGSELKAFEARTSRRVLRGRGIDTPDYYLSLLEFEDGTVVSMENSWILPGGMESVFEFGAEIVGTDGRIDIDTSHHGSMKVYDAHGVTYPDLFCLVEDRGQVAGFNVQSIRHFVSCIQGGEPPAVSTNDALAVTRALERIEAGAVEVG